MKNRRVQNWNPRHGQNSAGPSCHDDPMIPLFLAVNMATASTCSPLNRTFVPDHGWAEVWRRGPHGGRGLEGKIDRTKVRVPSDPKLYSRAAGLLDSTSKLPRMLPYGCWFYFNTQGSGAFLNVGRSLRARTRKEMTEALGLPCCPRSTGTRAGGRTTATYRATLCGAPSPKCVATTRCRWRGRTKREPQSSCFAQAVAPARR